MAIIKRFSLILLTFLILVNIGFAETEIYFSPGIEEQVIKKIDNAKETIDILIYSFTSKPIFNALKEADKRGVKISIIMDYLQSKGWKSLTKEIQKQNWKLKIMKGHHQGIQHNKILIADSIYLISGSFNFTESAEKRNHENILILDDIKIISQCNDYIDYLWEQ